MHLLGASYPTNLLLNVLMCSQSAQQLPKCPRKENLQACPDPNRTRILGGDVFCGTDQPAYGHTPVFVRLLKKQKLKQFVWGRVAFLHRGKVQLRHTTLLHPSTCLRTFHGAGGCGSVCVCVLRVLLPRSIQCPAPDARQMRTGPSQKKRHASQPRLFWSVYLIGGISTCLHSSSVPFFRQMLRPQ